MTEDDTFKALRKSSFETVHAIDISTVDNWFDELAKHGWTLEEYTYEALRRSPRYQSARDSYFNG